MKKINRRTFLRFTGLSLASLFLPVSDSAGIEKVYMVADCENDKVPYELSGKLIEVYRERIGHGHYRIIKKKLLRI